MHGMQTHSEQPHFLEDRDNVRIAVSAQEALIRFGAPHFMADVVFCDISMPNLNGIEF
ncbi:MAG: hypothetical protein P4M14_10330 [Gammaproteobacteria bacterium]|nr:hypothetical protein [Gammaproteobacteria bacterium]